MKIMRYIGLASAALISVLATHAITAESSISVPTLSIGRNLQAWTNVKLAQPAPQGGVHLTLTTDDPSRLLLSKAPDQPGSPSLTLTVLQGRTQGPDFCLQALAESGTATYTISGEGIGPAKGAVNLAPSAIIILGPYSAPRFPTTPRANPSRLSLVTVRLDSSRKVAEEQPVAGGRDIEVSLSNSNAGVGAFGAQNITFTAGSSTAATYFKPAGVGEATLAPVQPNGFTTPAERASVVAAVSAPAIAIAGDIYLGKDLQTSATVALGEPAPPEGLAVTLKSQDSSKLILSVKEDQPGSGTVTLTVPAGKQNAVYYLQGLDGSGVVAYTATAPGYQSRTANVGLARSGVMITYQDSGPPEEGNVFRKTGTHNIKEIYVSLAEAKQHPVRLIAWTAYIDQATGRAADFTVQPLRPGISADVVLTSSDPAVGTIDSPLVIRSSTNRAYAQFTPLTKGKTIISVKTPAGFSTPGNATTIPAMVSD